MEKRQAVINVISGERYKTITKETAGILKGEYGATASPVNRELQARVLDGKQPITCRPADLIEPEMDKLTQELRKLAREQGFKVERGEREIDDVLTYAMFPQIGLKFLQNRGNASAFEPAPTGKEEVIKAAPIAKQANAGPSVYTVNVGGQSYVVQVSEGGEINQIVAAASSAPVKPVPVAGKAEPYRSPLAGNIFTVAVKVGETVAEGQVLIIMEAMKMETELRSPKAGIIHSVSVAEGNSVAVGDELMTIG